MYWVLRAWMQSVLWLYENQCLVRRSMLCHGRWRLNILLLYLEKSLRFDKPRTIDPDIATDQCFVDQGTLRARRWHSKWHLVNPSTEAYCRKDRGLLPRHTWRFWINLDRTYCMDWSVWPAETGLSIACCTGPDLYNPMGIFQVAGRI